jgi:cytochrome c peroxidase
LSYRAAILFVFTLTSVVGAELITPIPFSMPYDTAKAALGEKLFFDTSLSADGSVSCNSCHDLRTSGTDNVESSFGVGGKKGQINSPTVYNSVFNFVQFWNGRAKDLREQAKGPILNPIEMANTKEGVVASLAKNKAYVAEFGKLYKDGITFNNIADAIAEFEKTLITPNSKFDNYLKGDKNAMNRQEKEGYELFQNKGCISCHNGVNLGGNMFQKIGVMVEYKDPKAINGRFDVSKKDSDKNMFKVPTLRNVELTAPYFHNGLVKDLKEAVILMGYHQLGIRLKEEEVDKIVAFLKTLTGKKPAKYSK